MLSSEEIGKRARKAAQKLASSSASSRNSVIENLIVALETRQDEIIEQNKLDLIDGEKSNLLGSVMKRLVLDSEKLSDLVKGLQDLITLDDPLGKVTLAREIASGMEMRRVSCPIGVLCIIFESRPEAVIQIASLALKSGNAVILKGGKEASHSNKCLVEIIRDILSTFPPESGISADCVQFVSSRDEVSNLLQLDQYIDLVIPRGSNKLVRDIKASTRIPVLGHDEGVCSIYVDEFASLEKAIPVVVDAKTQYPAACNAVEMLLIHRNSLSIFERIASALLSAKVTLHLDAETFPIAEATLSKLKEAAPSHSFGAVLPARPEDQRKEWSELDITVGVVDSMEEAATWANEYGSHHTDVIITEDKSIAGRYMNIVDSAGVYHNVSSRFADGFRYGFGAEVGISTNRIHARGPVGLEGLLTYKYKIVGNGECVGQFNAKGNEVVIGGITLPSATYTHRNLEC